MKIDLNPGAVSEVGINQEQLNFDAFDGDDYFKLECFILQLIQLFIENYIGSNGSDDVTLNHPL